MKFLNGVIVVSVLIVIAYLMYIVLIVEKFDNYVSDDKAVNSEILKYSVMLQESDDNKYKDLFEDDLFNTIKYTDSENGIKWSKWKKGHNGADTKVVRELVEYRLKMSKKTSGAKIIYCVLNRFKENVNKTNERLLDYDLMLYHKADKYADHVKLLCVINSQTKQIELVRYAVVGKVHEDNIYTHHNYDEDVNDINDTNSHINLAGYTHYQNVLNMEDTYESTRSEDREVKDILYSKISRDDTVDDEFVKNVQYTTNQNIVRKALLDKMLTDDSGIKGGVYKKYPYSNDFILECI